VHVKATTAKRTVSLFSFAFLLSVYSVMKYGTNAFKFVLPNRHPLSGA